MAKGYEDSPQAKKTSKPIGVKSGAQLGKKATRAIAERNKKPKGTKVGSSVGSKAAPKPGKSYTEKANDMAEKIMPGKKKKAFVGPLQAEGSKAGSSVGSKAAPKSKKQPLNNREIRGTRSSKEIGGKSYGSTGKRNAITNDLDNYISKMASETGDKYVKGAGGSGADTGKKKPGKETTYKAKPGSKFGTGKAKKAAPKADKPAGKSKGYGSRNSGGNSSSQSSRPSGGGNANNPRASSPPRSGGNSKPPTPAAKPPVRQAANTPIPRTRGQVVPGGYGTERAGITPQQLEQERLGLRAQAPGRRPVAPPQSPMAQGNGMPPAPGQMISNTLNLAGQAARAPSRGQLNPQTQQVQQTQMRPPQPVPQNNTPNRYAPSPQPRVPVPGEYYVGGQRYAPGTGPYPGRR